MKVEILGFTTRAWKGGKAREGLAGARTPHRAGAVERPAPHHLQERGTRPWRRVRDNLGLMMKEGLLKENIDGEALEWAHRRMVNRREAAQDP